MTKESLGQDAEWVLPLMFMVIPTAARGAVGVRAAMRPGMMATRLAKTTAPMATTITEGNGMVGSGTT